MCLLSYRPVARRRSRRSVLPNVSVSSAADEQLCTAGDDETRCCRRPLWISFREIGWDDWILAPDGYQAYYCYGACPPGHRTAHNHAAIRELVVAASAGGGLPIPRPACTATRLGPLTLAHYLNGRRVVSIIDNMIVEECRCAWNNDALPLINHGQTQSRLRLPDGWSMLPTRRRRAYQVQTARILGTIFDCIHPSLLDSHATRSATTLREYKLAQSVSVRRVRSSIRNGIVQQSHAWHSRSTVEHFLQVHLSASTDVRVHSLNYCSSWRRCHTSIKTRQVFLWSLRVSFEHFRVNFSHFLVFFSCVLVTFFRQFRSVEHPPVLLLTERVCCILLYISLLIAELGESEETYSQALQCISRGSWIRWQDRPRPTRG